MRRTMELDTMLEGIVPLLNEDPENQHAYDRTSSTYIPDYSLTVLLFGAVSFVLSVLFYTVQYSSAATDFSCQQRMWAFSPQSEFLQYETRRYDSDVISHDYVGIPTESRRNSWDTLWKTGRFSFPYDRLTSINKSIADHEWWSLPPPREQEAIAMSEAMHQVHCVGVI